MQYHVLGLMSGSSLDGLDIAYAVFTETSGKWTFEIPAASCVPYEEEWKQKLSSARELSAMKYLVRHSEYGHFLGEKVNEFIETHQLAYRIQLISSHGHTVFHAPHEYMTAQLGHGASIAAVTGIRTITDLRSSDIALGGQGAPVVPIGEKMLFPEYDYFLNIGGIANLSVRGEEFTGFDICPANRVLNMLSKDLEKGYDEDGRLAASGRTDKVLLEKLNGFGYYKQSHPKSLANEFGTEEIFPLIAGSGLSVADALWTYSQHIVQQIALSILPFLNNRTGSEPCRLLVTGGGAHNKFLIGLLKEELAHAHVEPLIPPDLVVDYKEALVMAFMGVLRWREDVNVMQTVTGASKDSINGAVWTA